MNVESHIGQYKILRTLGAGGMGTVYLGEHILLGRRAAIKTLLPALSSQREIVDRFFNEARAISAISDPGVVQIFDFGYHVDGTAYIVMEFLEGESLSTRLDRLRKLPLLDSLRITRQIAGSLADAHAQSIVHRDLKPGNVFMIRDAEAQGGERTKILDFGICKLGDDADGNTTQTGTMLGTPVYMSPEQCRGAGRADHRSDIYSVGCVLFHMLTGRPPFDCDSVGEFIASHLKEDPEPPSKFEPTIPPAVDEIVMRCLAKAPEERFQSMKDLQAAVERTLAEISDSGVNASATPITRTPLATGFRSAYDGSRGTSVRTANTTGNQWFVDSMAEAPAPLSDQWDTPNRRRSVGRILLLGAALFVGIVGGLNATREYLDDKTPVQSPALETSASVDEPKPNDVTLAREPAPPPEPLIEDIAAADEQQAEPQPTVAAAPPPVVKKVKRPPRPHVTKRPKPRREVDREPQTQSVDNEDLYDTR